MRISGFTVAVVLICVLGSTAYLLCRAHKETPQIAYVLKRETLKVTTQKIEEQFREAVEKAIIDCFPETLRLNLENGQGVATLRELLKRCGWIESVDEAEITRNGSLKAIVRLKRPYAWCEEQEGFVLIDERGN
ncbi:MAG: hypothetical protein N2234_07065, partial [Planctomycetota bacterium]|nr:hypothetical protein [Planctomycetota bacterium]